MKENKDRINIKGSHKELVIMVYCRVCWHWFCDSVDWEKAKDKNIDTAFICPFCHTKLWLK